MRLVKPLLFGFSLAAFAATSVYASGTSHDKSSSASSGSTSATVPISKLNFDKADTNHDGKLSREEYNAMLKNAGGSSASAGSSTSGGVSKSTPSASSSASGGTSKSMTK